MAPFLSTLPARGATAVWLICLLLVSISIHAPREGSDLAVLQPVCRCCLISIHAPREGSDPNLCLISTGSASFLSTLPARGATLLLRTLFGHELISIHAPREGSDR